MPVMTKCWPEEDGAQRFSGRKVKVPLLWRQKGGLGEGQGKRTLQRAIGRGVKESAFYINVLPKGMMRKKSSGQHGNMLNGGLRIAGQQQKGAQVRCLEGRKR